MANERSSETSSSSESDGDSSRSALSKSPTRTARNGNQGSSTSTSTSNSSSSKDSGEATTASSDSSSSSSSSSSTSSTSSDSSKSSASPVRKRQLSDLRQREGGNQTGRRRSPEPDSKRRRQSSSPPRDKRRDEPTARKSSDRPAFRERHRSRSREAVRARGRRRSRSSDRLRSLRNSDKREVRDSRPSHRQSRKEERSPRGVSERGRKYSREDLPPPPSRRTEEVPRREDRRRFEGRDGAHERGEPRHNRWSNNGTAHSDERPRGEEWGTKGNRAEPKREEKQVEPNFGLSGALAEETNKVNGVVLVYSEPPEASHSTLRWRLYIFKGGDLVGEPLYIHRQSSYLFGRERRVADIPADHPSCSKQHAVLQYRRTSKDGPDGMPIEAVRPYLMDLGSVNGTFINNEKLEAQRYYELIEKDVVKLGNSSREYVLLHEGSVNT